MSQFVDISPTLDTYWRSIILFGRNVASYKFALGKVLLDFASEEKTFVPLEELAPPFALNIAEHLKTVDRQGTSGSSRFLDACRAFNRGEITQDQLVEQTLRLGFNNVIDAFHVVNQAKIPKRFFVDERKSRNGILITDELLRLKEHLQFHNLPHEVEARWRLVETAWHLELTPSLLAVRYDPADGQLYVRGTKGHRIDVTSSRDALNGYQKGKCFYCIGEISVREGTSTCSDVDHFFPLKLLDVQPPYGANLNGVWNLVLACTDCNRGPAGKHTRVPETRYLERLQRRNDYLIDSHHPLKDTLIAQTGRTEPDRRRFLQGMCDYAVQLLIHRWSPASEGPPAF